LVNLTAGGGDSMDTKEGARTRNIFLILFFICCSSAAGAEEAAVAMLKLV